MLAILIAMLLVGFLGYRLADRYSGRGRIALRLQAYTNILLSTGLLAYAFMA